MTLAFINMVPQEKEKEIKAKLPSPSQEALIISGVHLQDEVSVS